jgi:hypothetical protein
MLHRDAHHSEDSFGSIASFRVLVYELLSSGPTPIADVSP